MIKPYFLKTLLPAICLISICNKGLAQYFSNKNSIANHWVDSVFNTLNKKEKIAQLMLVRAHSNLGTPHIKQVNRLIKKYNIGGLCFFQGGPVRQALLTNQYQQKAKTPLLISIDAEWGLGMRLDSVINFPRNLMIGATNDEQLAFMVGHTIGEQCQRMGIHINFAPVVDVNNNPNNPVINDRSFGEDINMVSRLGTAYMKGLQSQNILACAKHFPGHGDVSTDSHLDLPVINKSFETLNNNELQPFKTLIKNGVGSIMLAHLNIPALDSSLHTPSSLSKPIATTLLRDSLQFKGIAITDALEMKGVTKYFTGGKASLQSIMAGNDLICLPTDVKKSIKAIKKAVAKNEISQQTIDEKVKKILLLKYHVGLNHPSIIDTTQLVQHLNNKTLIINQAIAQKAITAIGSSNISIPFNVKNTDVLPKVAYICIGNGKSNTATELMEKYWNADVYYFNNSYATNDTVKATIEPQQGISLIDTKEKMDNALNILQQINTNYHYIIIGVHQYNRRPANNFGLSASAIYLMQQAANKTNSIISYFGNPYASKFTCNTTKTLLCYEDDSITQSTAIDVLRGIIKAQGKLPVTVCK